VSAWSPSSDLGSAAGGGSSAGVSPVERFLGAGALRAGPFGLLGVVPSACTDAAVIAALQTRLAMLAAHPQSVTPEADEVRLALHAAAAQLLDPRVRASMMQTHAGATVLPSVQPTPARDGVTTNTPRGLSPAELALEHDAIITLGSMGGWNQEALRRLAMMAHSRGLGSDAVARAVLNLTGRGRARQFASAPVAANGASGSTPGGAMTHAPDAARSTTGAGAVTTGRSAGIGATSLPRISAAAFPDRAQPDLPGEPEERRDWKFLGDLGIIAAVAVLGIGLLGGGLYLGFEKLGFGGSKKDQGVVELKDDALNTPVQGTKPPEQLFAEKSATAEASPTPTSAAAPEDAARAIRAAAEGLEVDPDTGTRQFEEIIAGLADNWPGLRADQLAATTDAIVEFTYRVAAWPELSERVIEALHANDNSSPGENANPGRRLTHRAWASGVFTRLTRERDIPARTRWALDAALSDLGDPSPQGGGTFEVGARASLMSAIPGLIPDVSETKSEGVREAWEAWSRALAAACRSDENKRVRATIIALERLMTDGPEPTQHRGVFEAIGALVGTLSFKSPGDAQDAILRWMIAPGISTADLFALTKPVSEQPAISGGIDTSLVVPVTASERTRADLRERYARVWGRGEAVSRDEARTAWAKKARETLGDAETSAPGVTGMTGVMQLAKALELSRLSEAAAALWSGDSARALDAMNTADASARRVSQAVTQATRASVTGGANDGEWGTQFRAAANVAAAKRRLLTELPSIVPEPGPIDAAVLVNEALRGESQTARVAREQVMRWSSKASVINALLEQAPMMPRSNDVAQMIETVSWGRLPRPSHPDFRREVRRVLVERLLSLLASREEAGLIDELAMELSTSYAARAGLGPTPQDDSGAATKAENPEDSDRGQAPPDAGNGTQKDAAADGSIAAHQNDADAQRANGASGQSAELAARSLRAVWRRAAERAVPTGKEPWPLAELERRAAGRVALGQGPVQRFAAEQLAAVELMGFVVIAEDPSRATKAGAVLRTLATQRAISDSILTQIHAVERAALELWLLRFSESDS
jgi:hypothetical protein